MATPLDGAIRYVWCFRSPDGERLDTTTARLREWLADTERGNATMIAVLTGLASRILRGLYVNLAMERALSLEITGDVILLLNKGKIEPISPRRDSSFLVLLPALGDGWRLS